MSGFLSPSKKCDSAQGLPARPWLAWMAEHNKTRLVNNASHEPSQAWYRSHAAEVVQTTRRERLQAGGCSWGFTLFPHQAATVATVLDSGVIDQCVVLRRRNTTAQYLSWKTAVATGCWQHSASANEDSPACAASTRVTALGPA